MTRRSKSQQEIEERTAGWVLVVILLILIVDAGARLLWAY